MTNLSTKTPAKGRASRTRTEILEAAERLFATRGFSDTRLEDVADEIGLTRSALFYHFKDKQSLHDAMVANAFNPLTQALHEALDSKDKSISRRIEKAVEAWVDCIVARPTLARLILRFVADQSDLQVIQKIFLEDQLLPLKFFSLFEEGKKSGELKPTDEDPFHTASAIIGTTVFYVGALATLLPQGIFEPLAPAQVKAHKRDSVASVRRLLGINTQGLETK